MFSGVNVGDLISMQYEHRPNGDDTIDHLPDEQSEVSSRLDHLCYDMENNSWAVKESENCKH